MEREQKRRKVHEEDEEEQKMEMFFALIRSTKDARDRLMKTTEDRLKKDEQEKKMMVIKNNDNELPTAQDHNHKKAVWIPKFEWEDFMEGANNNSSNTQFMNIKARSRNNQVGPSQRSLGRCQEAKEEDGNGLDLKLSL